MAQPKDPPTPQPATPEEPGPAIYPIVHGFGGLDAKGQEMIMELMRREAKLRDENPGMRNPLMHKSKPKPPSKG